ncbi:MAG: class I SAM-dependent methyltransferase [Bacillota bacterium]|nr:class I SAM-dependent methyltransferase [Bacillota bacterium]
MKDKISKSYEQSKNIYDDILTSNKWWSKLYLWLFWNGVDDNEIQKRLLEHIPDDFSGKLLDVPVGTAVFTYNKYKKLKNADIRCLDYSTEMLAQAKMRFYENSINNVDTIQGDVGDLPFEDETFDIVLCMNGIHAFPNKEQAYKEMHRVLKKGGKFLVSLYVEKEYIISDLLVKLVLSKKGWFSPPFETISSLKNRISKNYVIEDFYSQKSKSIIYFVATKKGDSYEI